MISKHSAVSRQLSVVSYQFYKALQHKKVVAPLAGALLFALLLWYYWELCEKS